MALWQRPGSYDPSRASLQTWLLGVTHHKAVDLVRRAQRRRVRTADEQELAQLALAQTPLEDTVIAALRSRRLRAAVREPPFALRQLIVLAYFDGYSQSQIAALTATPLGTVKTRTRTAMRRLAEITG